MADPLRMYLVVRRGAVTKLGRAVAPGTVTVVAVWSGAFLAEPGTR